jgi:hypothetical protein
LQSCDQEIVQGSLDANRVRYEYTFNGLQRVSPSGEAIGYNIGVFFASGGAGAAETNGRSSFFKNRFSNTQFLATASKDHGPFYNDNENLELNTGVNYSNIAASNNISQNIRFLGGVEFVGKGGDKHFYYFEAPLYATYWKTLKENGEIFGGLGPYVSYGIGSAFGSNGGFKPFDAGVSARAGYKMVNGFSFSLGYDYGLANISKEGGFNDETAQNRSISLNVGYPLQKLIKRK